jgi:hypothetical protein
MYLIEMLYSIVVSRRGLHQFTETLKTTCNLKSRQCRGGSKDLYKLLIKSPSAYQYLKTDEDHLQIDWKFL